MDVEPFAVRISSSGSAPLMIKPEERRPMETRALDLKAEKQATLQRAHRPYTLLAHASYGGMDRVAGKATTHADIITEPRGVRTIRDSIPYLVPIRGYLVQ